MHINYGKHEFLLIYIQINVKKIKKKNLWRRVKIMKRNLRLNYKENIWRRKPN